MDKLTEATYISAQSAPVHSVEGVALSTFIERDDTWNAPPID